MKAGTHHGITLSKSMGIVGICLVIPLLGQETSTKSDNDSKRAARLEFMRDAVQKISIQPINPADKRDLQIKPQPLLRYSDPARGVADSAVWRVGIKGRPIAIVTSEVYGPNQNKEFQMNHEFLAVDNPQLTMKCGFSTWQPPPATALKFQDMKTDERPAEKPQLRLNQMKRLAAQFTMRQFHEGNNIELRMLPTPIDRYEPSEKPRADGAIFAGVWGVNPEILLFLETDGSIWSYAFDRTSSAKLWATLDDNEVWTAPATDVTQTTKYSIIVNPAKVPATTFED